MIVSPSNDKLNIIPSMRIKNINLSNISSPNSLSCPSSPSSTSYSANLAGGSYTSGGVNYNFSLSTPPFSSVPSSGINNNINNNNYSLIGQTMSGIGSSSGLSSPSRKQAQLYKDFCARYLTLSSLTIRLSSSQELVTISEALKLRHSISTLNLSHNKSIKDLDAWIAFGFALKMPSQTITNLDLSHNYLGAEGLSPIISDVIRANKSLTWLNLSFNSLDQDENHSILEALVANQTITHLDLSYNEYQLSSDVSKRLCNYIATSKSIATLNFNNNSTRNPLRGLPAAIKANTSLKCLDLSSMTFADSDAHDLLRALLNSPTVESIKLFHSVLSTCNMPLGDRITEALALRYQEHDLIEDEKLRDSLQGSPRSSTLCEIHPLTYLNIGGINFGRKGFAAFLDIFSRNQDIDNLDISANQLNEANGEELANFIQLNESIRTLNISNNGLYEKTVAIADALKNNHSITNLNMSNTRSSNLIGKVLARALPLNQTLTVLDISRTKLGPGGLLDFALQLGLNNIKLEYLNLDETDLGDRGTALIGEALLTNTTLKHLSLNTNSIKKDGAKSLGKALKKNTTLQTLQLGYNQIDVGGLKSIANGLKINTKLSELSIKNNFIPDKGGVQLAESLKNNRTLEVLNLHGNLFGNKCGMAILKLLSHNHTLITVDVSHNQIEKELQQEIGAAYRRNQYITSMNISQSEMESITDSPRFFASPNSAIHPNYSTDSLTHNQIKSFLAKGHLSPTLSCSSLPNMAIATSSTMPASALPSPTSPPMSTSFSASSSSPSSSPTTSHLQSSSSPCLTDGHKQPSLMRRHAPIRKEMSMTSILSGRGPLAASAPAITQHTQSTGNCSP
ncbi:hypothetical protein SAMD00019534_009270 [Acytostelium subglobosum LB1]|uniref:hypothetical protein n=1 Tax=Acytostelium subglobosum LB1 TaxID=1410327 RepID=UPI0006450327|nr:hypothetical protein SAMD00019534_009270 [Acytostelium subglobosum LB1]GAM17752.1 hypothetical protein SAMD00019534_009270 [Acytostelium subglobosum LB1]|eukprot:XP_012758348.1 hypothetical protein SAMD00019534_009270 [Acytostelium subglobosum LB1]